MVCHLNQLLKELSNNLTPCLTLLFRASLHQSALPEDWVTALVTPLFKRGNRSDPSHNYRPISLTSVCCKVLEPNIYSSITEYTSHLESYNVISNSQFGFMQSVQLNNNYSALFMIFH